MPGIFDVLAGNAQLADVALNAAACVALVCVLLAAAILVSRLAEKLVVGVLSLVAGTGLALVIECYLTFPGVVYHELSHALAALLTGARVTKISLRPRRSGDGYVLGSVTYVPCGGRIRQAFQLFITGLAPSVTGLAGMAGMVLGVLPLCTLMWQRVLWGYLFACLLLHTGLSRQDLHGMYAGAPIVLLVLLAVFLVVPFDAFGLVQQALDALGALAA